MPRRGEVGRLIFIMTSSQYVFGVCCLLGLVTLTVIRYEYLLLMYVFTSAISSAFVYVDSYEKGDVKQKLKLVL